MHNFKVKEDRQSSFKSVASRAVRKWLESRARINGEERKSVTTSDVAGALIRINSVTCNGSDLMDKMDYEDATLEDLNSEQTPTT